MAKALTTKINEQQRKIARDIKRVQREIISGSPDDLIVSYHLGNISLGRAVLIELLLERVAELEAQVATFGKEYEVGQ